MTAEKSDRRRGRPTLKRAAAKKRAGRSGAAILLQARLAADKAIEEARRAHARLRDAIDILPEGIVFLDAEGRYIMWNRQYAEIYKGSADLFQPGTKFADTLRVGVERGEYPDAIGCEEEWLAERLSYLSQAERRHEQKLIDGRTILIEERRTSDGGNIGLRVDITELKNREESFRLLFKSNPVPMFLFALDDGSMLAVNEAAVEHYRYPRERFLTLTLAMLQTDGADLSRVVADSNDLQSGRTWTHRRGDGSLIDVALFSRQLTYADRPAALITAIDITERRRAEARVAYMAHHDALTTLPNRILLRLRMEEALGRLGRRAGRVATLCLDLDNFKIVNDTLGHATGDLLLQQVAAKLRSCVSENDTVARLGGDEFAILQCGIEGPAAASGLAQKILDILAEPFALDGHQVAVSTSIGIAFASSDADDADRLLKSADMALYRAKADGRSAFRFFEPAMDAHAQSRRRLELELRKALTDGGLSVEYQPFVTLASGSITGFEALVRWRHDELGVIPPAEFVQIAEETGLIGTLGAFVMRRACADAAQWPPDVKVAVNLSALQFRNGALLPLVMDALNTSGLAARRLELEITESVLLEKSPQVIATLHALRALGASISLDDFGTGYSSLSYLRSFPFDKIKIDRSFIRDIQWSQDSQAIVRAVLSLGSSLGITITAEGIETEDQLACLRQQGCNEGQGYLFSMARPQAETLGMFARHPVFAAAVKRAS